MGVEFRVNTQDRVRQVVGTMALENMYFSKEFLCKLIQVSNGDLSSEELRQEVIKKYGRQ